MINLKLSQREKYIFITSLIVIGAALSYNFIIEPFLDKWKTIDSKIMITKARLKKGIRLLNGKDDIINRYKNYSYSGKDISDILNYIENKASSLGIEILNIAPLPLIENEFYDELLIKIEIECEFIDIKRFTSELLERPVFFVKEANIKVTEKPSLKTKATLILSKTII